MKRFVTTIALTLSLSGIAFAGDVPSVGITAIEPETPATATNTAAPGEIPTVNSTVNFLDAAQSLIQTMVGVIV